MIVKILYSQDANPDPNIVHKTGYQGQGFLIIHGRRQVLVVSGRDYVEAKQSSAEVVLIPRGSRVSMTISDILSKIRYDKIGVDKQRMPVAVFESLTKVVKKEFVDISTELWLGRMVKTPQEITKITEACRICDNIYEEIINNFDFGSEGQVKSFIETSIIKRGCSAAFPPIVANGANSAIPHYSGNAPLGQGFLLLDFGARCKGYCSDMTRMLFLGKPSAEEIADYQRVLSAQQSTLSVCKSGTRFSSLDRHCRKELGEIQEKFIHALGHSLGLEIHEYPTVGSTTNMKIREGIVFTIEPGIYLEGRYGIRVEDTVVIRQGKLDVLTQSGRDLAVINYKNT